MCLFPPLQIRYKNTCLGLGAGGRGPGAGGWQIAQSGKCLPEFSPQSPHTKLSVVVHSCNPNAGKWEAGDPWNVLASQLLIREPQVKVRASLKKTKTSWAVVAYE